MIFQINWVETFWLVVSLAGFFVTAALVAGAVGEFWGYRKQPGLDNGSHRLRLSVLVSALRRETLRLLVQTGLLVTVMPSLLRPGDIVLVFDFDAVARFIQIGEYSAEAQATLGTVAILSLITVPPLLLVNSLLDLREKRRLRRMSELLITPEAAALITVDEESLILYSSESASRMFGYEDHELVGTSLLKLQPEQYRQKHLAAYAQFRATGQRTLDWNGLHLEGLHKDGSVFPITVTLVGGRLDGKRMVTGIIREGWV